VRGTNGSVSLNYPITLNFTYPDSGTAYPGDTIQIYASYAPGAATIRTNTPTVDAWIDTPFAFSAQVHAAAHPFAPGLFDDDIVHFGFHTDPTIPDSDWLVHSNPFATFILNYLLSKATAKVLSFSLRALDLNLTGGLAGNGLQLQAQNQDDFFKLKADLTN